MLKVNPKKPLKAARLNTSYSAAMNPRYTIFTMAIAKRWAKRRWRNTTPSRTVRHDCRGHGRRRALARERADRVDQVATARGLGQDVVKAGGVAARFDLRAHVAGEGDERGLRLPAASDSSRGLDPVFGSF